MNDAMTLDQFRLWNINALKAYLHIRGKNTDGGLEELAARYVCQETFICVISGKRTGRCSRFLADLIECFFHF